MTSRISASAGVARPQQQGATAIWFCDARAISAIKARNNNSGRRKLIPKSAISAFTANASVNPPAAMRRMEKSNRRMLLHVGTGQRGKDCEVTSDMRDSPLAFTANKHICY